MSSPTGKYSNYGLPRAVRNLAIAASSHYRHTFGMSDKTGHVVRIGISSCLLGEKVRYDGNHKHDHYISGTLGRVFHFVPYCPEVGIGLGVPREPIRLEGDSQEISGFIFKSSSPSCGMERVKVYQPQGTPRLGRGIFASALMAGLPLLPVEEEGRLGDPAIRENFLERVFTFHRWQQLNHTPLTAHQLVEFHTRHKLIVMAHRTEAYRALGRLVAEAGQQPIDELAAHYITGLMAALKHHATPRRHTNVLHHLLGYLKKQLDSADKAELLELIEQYRLGHLPLIVPKTLLRHHFRRHPHPYVAEQLYLEPSAQERLRGQP
jgi:uncharacterized protein YbgA (DUF1722 family)/uncharacterized protein YbbK (DUF523 family)